MKEKFISVVMAVVVFATGIYGQITPAKAVTQQTISSDYVLIVNTNLDPTDKQSTGNITFDNGGTFVSSRKEEVFSKQTFTPSMAIKQSITQKSNLVTKTYQVGEELLLASCGKTYVCIGEGTKSYIWMEKNYYSEYVVAQKVQDIANEAIDVFEGLPYTVLNEMADGNIPYSDQSGKLSLFLGNTNGAAGLYWGDKNITGIHVSAPVASAYNKGVLDSMNGLLVHEGQHALFDKITCDSGRYPASSMAWFNEGLAVAAMDYHWGGIDPTSWLSQINGNSILRNGSALFYANGYRGTAVQDYSMPYLFVRYLANQRAKGYEPMEFFKSVYKTKLTAQGPEKYLQDLLVANEIEGSVKDVLIDFYQAIFTQSKSGKHGFYGDATVRRQVGEYPIYLGNSGESVSLPGTGAIVVKTIGGQFIIPENKGADIQFVALENRTDNLMPSKGKGTVEEPYEITSLAELNTMSLNPTKHYKLMGDIDVTNKTYFTPQEFYGSLDGNGYTIIGLGNSLFDTLKLGAKALNLTIVGNFSKDYSNTMGIVANYNEGCIADCKITGAFSPKLTGARQLFYPKWGTLVGDNGLSGQVLRCSSEAEVNITVTANHVTIGGLVGVNRGKISDCFVRGSLVVNQPRIGNYNVYVGGLIGQLRGSIMSTNVSRSYTLADVKVTLGNNSSAKLQLGRICGDELNGKIANVTSVYGLSGMPMSGEKTDPAIFTSQNERTAEALKKRETYEGFCFEGIWKEVVGSYPVHSKGEDIKVITATLGRSTYFKGEQLSLHGSTISVNQGVSLDLTEEMLVGSNWDSSTLGDKIIKGRYKGKEFTLNVKVIEPTKVSNLQIYKAGKVDYYQGEKFDISGYVFTASLNDQSYSTYLYSGVSIDKEVLEVTDKEVVFTYGNATVKQPIHVVERLTPQSINLTRPLTIRNYTVGDMLDWSDVNIQITYKDGSTSPVLIGEDIKKAGVKAAIYKDKAFSAMENGILSESHSGGSIYFYLEDSFIVSGNGVNAFGGSITVYPPLIMDDFALFINKDYSNGVGVEGVVESKGVTGGSKGYTTKRIKGELPLGVYELDKPESQQYGIFSYYGYPTTLGRSDLVYEIIDNVTNKVIEVKVTIWVVEPLSEGNITSIGFYKAMNKHLPEDVLGTIEGNDIYFHVPEGIELTKIATMFTLSNGATSDPINGVEFNYETQNANQITVTAPDQKTKKIYNLHIVRMKENYFYTTFMVGDEKWKVVETPTGQVPVLPEPPVQDGKVFMGWYDLLGNKVEEYVTTQKVVAHFTDGYKIEVVGGKIPEGQTTGIYKYNQKVTITRNKEENKGTFLGWYIESENLNKENELVCNKDTYSFYAYKSLKVVAKYGQESEKQPILKSVKMDHVVVLPNQDGSSSIRFIGHINLKEGDEVAEAGFVYTGKREEHLSNEEITYKKYLEDGSLVRNVPLGNFTTVKQFSVTVVNVPVGKQARGRFYMKTKLGETYTYDVVSEVGVGRT